MARYYQKDSVRAQLQERRERLLRQKQDRVAAAARNRTVGDAHQQFLDSADASTGLVGLVVEATPFYAEQGGQIYDTGAITARIMGLRFDDFLIPGGYGEIVGVRAP